MNLLLTVTAVLVVLASSSSFAQERISTVRQAAREMLMTNDTIARMSQILGHISYADSIRFAAGDRADHVTRFTVQPTSIEIATDRNCSFKIFDLASGYEVWSSNGRMTRANETAMISTDQLLEHRPFLVAAYDMRGINIGYKTFAKR